MLLALLALDALASTLAPPPGAPVEVWQTPAQRAGLTIGAAGVRDGVTLERAGDQLRIRAVGEDGRERVLTVAWPRTAPARAAAARTGARLLRDLAATASAGTEPLPGAQTTGAQGADVVGGDATGVRTGSTGKGEAGPRVEVPATPRDERGPRGGVRPVGPRAGRGNTTTAPSKGASTSTSDAPPSKGSSTTAPSKGASTSTSDAPPSKGSSTATPDTPPNKGRDLPGKGRSTATPDDPPSKGASTATPDTPSNKGRDLPGKGRSTVTPDDPPHKGSSSAAPSKGASTATSDAPPSKGSSAAAPEDSPRKGLDLPGKASGGETPDGRTPKGRELPGKANQERDGAVNPPRGPEPRAGRRSPPAQERPGEKDSRERASRGPIPWMRLGGSVTEREGVSGNLLLAGGLRSGPVRVGLHGEWQAPRELERLGNPLQLDGASLALGAWWSPGGEIAPWVGARVGVASLRVSDDGATVDTLVQPQLTGEAGLSFRMSRTLAFVVHGQGSADVGLREVDTGGTEPVVLSPWQWGAGASLRVDFW